MDPNQNSEPVQKSVQPEPSLNKKWLIIGAVVFLFILSGALFFFSSNTAKNQTPTVTPSLTGPTPPDKKPFQLYPGNAYEPNKLIVEFRSGMGPDEELNVAKKQLLENKLSEIGVISRKKVFDSNDSNLKNFYEFTLKPGTDLKTAGEKINDLEAVKSVEANYEMHAISIPNDTYYSQQWHYKKIGLESAWDKTKGSTSIIVAVTDTGIDYNHEDFDKANIIKGISTAGGTDVMDQFGHGTHVSGTIGAMSNNSLGVAGVNWNVKILAIKVLGSNGSGSDTGIANGMKYAADNGARVLNMSLGSTSPMQCSSLYQSAINYAYNKGVTIVVAAGNSNDSASQYTPANCANVITVGATDNNDQKASFSNYGSRVDIAAPGVNILSNKAATCSPQMCLASKIVGGKYVYSQGTSMAAPHVAGVAALLLSANPGLSPQQVKDCITKSTNTDPAPSSISGKRVNMDKILSDPACGGTGGNPTEVPTVTLSPSPSPSLTPTLTPRPGVTITLTPGVGGGGTPTNIPTGTNPSPTPNQCLNSKFPLYPTGNP